MYWIQSIFDQTLNTMELTWWFRWQRFCLLCRRPRFSLWVRKTLWRREWQPTPLFLPGEFHGQRSLAGYSSWGRRELDTTGWHSTPQEHKLCLSNTVSLTPSTFPGTQWAFSKYWLNKLIYGCMNIAYIGILFVHKIIHYGRGCFLHILVSCST